MSNVTLGIDKDEVRKAVKETSEAIMQELDGRVIVPDDLREPYRPFLPISARPGSELVRAELRDILDADQVDLEWVAWTIAREIERRRTK